MQQIAGRSKPAIPGVPSNRVFDCLDQISINSGKAVNCIYVYRVGEDYFIVDGEGMSQVEAAQWITNP